MVLVALGFVFGAWLLQQQPVLPNIFIGLQVAWILILSLAVLVYFNRAQHQLVLKNLCNLLVAGSLGFV
ncbi:MAG TPA: hypothetical protein VLA25_01115 [Methylotenera sp.]|nr:hypothetical protein [Methylotenera sp.]